MSAALRQHTSPSPTTCRSRPRSPISFWTADSRTRLRSTGCWGADVILVPNIPYDAPPGVNRPMGVRWLTSVLHPQQFPGDLRDTTRQFYRLFYQVDLSEEQIDILLTPATSSKRER